MGTRSFFKRPEWATRSEDSPSTEFYRRSQQTYRDIVEADRQRREAALKQRASAEKEQKELEAKRRRVSSEAAEKAPEADRSQSADVQTNEAKPIAQDNVIDLESPSAEGQGHGQKDQGDVRIGSRPEPGDSASDIQEISPSLPRREIPERIHDESESRREHEARSTLDNVSLQPRELQTPTEHAPLGHKASLELPPEKPTNEKQVQPATTDARPQNTAPPPPPPEEDPVVQILITSEIPNTKPLVVQRKLSQRLRDVRLAWCQRQGFDERMTSGVFLTWNRKRLFDVTTCKSLGIHKKSMHNGWPFDMSADDDVLRVHMVATTEELQARETKQAQRNPFTFDDEQEEQPEPKPMPTIKVILKNPVYGDLTVKVIESTAIADLITQYREKMKIPQDKEVYLLFDGDRLDPDSSVKDADITDSDLVDVQVK